MALLTEVRLRSRHGETTVEPANAKKTNRPSKRQRRLAKEQEEQRDASAGMFEAAQKQLQQEMQAAGMLGSLPMSFGATRKRKRSQSKDEIELGKDHEEKTAAKDSEDQQHSETGEATVEEGGEQAHQDEHVAVDDDNQVAGDDYAEAEETQPQTATTIVDKVRVIYNSDGEEAERVVEKVEVTTETVPEQSIREIQHKNSAPEKKSKQSKQKKSKYPVPKDVVKFYVQRHLLFYKFEDGIQLDHESWYSVTPQAIAEHIAQRLKCDVVVDPFAGCGGNVIQLAKTCKQVIAIDIDPAKIRMAKHNAELYGVADKIEWIVGNSVEILPNLKADAIFLSPPWGGINYSRKAFSLDDMIVKGVSGVDLFAMARKVTKNIAYYLPKTTPTADLEALSPEETVECENIFLNKQLKVVTAYYGDLAVSEKDSTTDQDGSPTESSAQT